MLNQRLWVRFPPRTDLNRSFILSLVRQPQPWTVDLRKWMAGAGSEKPRIEPSTMQLEMLRLSSRNVNLGMYKPSLPETIRKAKTLSVFKNLGYPSPSIHCDR